MNTHEIILRVAGAEFAEHGLAGARVDRIAMRANINKAMIYYHFRSKDQLYQAVIENHVQSIGQFLEGAFTEESGLETFLFKLARFYNSIASERSTFVPILLREIASGGERFRVALSNVIVEKGLSRKFQKIIDDGAAKGELRKVDSKQAIISFIGMNIFYIMVAPMINQVWEIHDERAFRENRPQEVVDLFLYGLKAR